MGPVIEFVVIQDAVVLDRRMGGPMVVEMVIQVEPCAERRQDLFFPEGFLACLLYTSPSPRDS